MAQKLAKKQLKPWNSGLKHAFKAQKSYCSTALEAFSGPFLPRKLAQELQQQREMLLADAGLTSMEMSKSVGLEDQTPHLLNAAWP